MLEISEDTLQKMFEHYIERRRYAERSTGYDAMWANGECSEAEKWLKAFGVDLSYVRISAMMLGEMPVRVYD